MTSEGRDEPAEFGRESRRAVRHFLVLWFGFPALLILGISVLGRVAMGFGDGEVLRPVVWLCIGGPLTYLFGRWLWRLVKL